MCLLGIIKNPCTGVRLALAANRDEFYARPSSAIAYWRDYPNIIGGRDESSGGTWLGITPRGNYAAVLNFRAPSLYKADRISRGLLVRDFLVSSLEPSDFIQSLRGYGDRYNPFILVTGQMTKDVALAYHSTSECTNALSDKICTLSNGSLEASWPKQRRLEQLIASMSCDSSNITAKLLAILRDNVMPPDAELPTTGISPDQERLVSPIFISSPLYGTCSSSVIILDDQGNITFTERRFNDSQDTVDSVIVSRFEK